jgi:Kef-type K+ transport system membrane component KefB
VPVVVVEPLLGVVIGPHMLGLHVDEFISFFADLGLGLLFFFAGYEIDVRRIRGHPLRLALLGWALSLALAYTIGGVLATAGVVLSLLYTGSALATTAIGTLIPILSDTGELRTRFGSYLRAAGAIGEFGPILLLTLALSTDSTLHNALILIAFIGLAVGVAVLAVRSSERTLPFFERTLETSSQLMVRWIVVLAFALALLAFELGLDLLLGGFAAGIIARGAENARHAGVGLQAQRRRVRRVRAVLLHRQRYEAGRHSAVRERLRRRQDVSLLRAVLRGTRHACAASISARA